MTSDQPTPPAATNEALYVTRLTLQNFRPYANLELDVHPRLTVLTAPNGGGKTTILDGIAKGLAVFVFLAERYDLYTKLDGDDVRRVRATHGGLEPVLPMSIKLLCHCQGDVLGTTLTQITLKPRKIKLQYDDPLANFGMELHQKVIDAVSGKLQDSPTLPVIAYYGTERVWGDGNWRVHRAAKRDDSSRFQGYRDCLDPSASYHFFEKWFENLSFAAWQANQRDDNENQYLARLKAVQSAVTIALQGTGWGNIKWDSVVKSLVVERIGIGWFPIGWTSDGIINIVGLVGDIAHRCSRLNPQFGAEAAQKTPGVVLIDEVDMHLHPEWQQTIIHSLLKAFPLIQFIVTTHSPQVLSTVQRETIRVIGADSNGQLVAVPPLAMTYGEPSGDVLHSVMMVDPQPPVSEKADLQRLTEWVDQGSYNTPEAEQLRQRLVSALGDQHPQLQRLQRSIRRQEMLKP